MLIQRVGRKSRKLKVKGGEEEEIKMHGVY